MKQKRKTFKMDAILISTIVPIVLVMISVFFMLTRNEFLKISRDRLALESWNYAEDISKWTEKVLEGLGIYKGVIDQMGLDNEKTFQIIDTTYETHEEYPYGMYMGDDRGMYYDASGWIPGEDFIVTEREWYKEGLKHNEFTFGEPYLDAMTGNTCVSVTTRVDYEPAVTVLAVDVYLDYALKQVQEIVKGNIERAFLVTGESRTVVVSSDTFMAGMPLTGEESPSIYQDINQLLDGDIIGQSEITVDGKIYFVDINQIENADWYFVTCISKQEMLKDLKRLELLMLMVAAVAAFILFLVIHKIIKDLSVIKRKAKTDPLTKLLNRAGFLEMMQYALETNPGQGILLILDMDNFKQVNDELGHPVGDEVLKQFAVMLESFFNRNKDIVARIGGDEFVVFMGRDIKREDAEVALNKFTGLVRKTFEEKYPGRKLSVSIGGSFLKPGRNYKELYQGADNALYEVKRNGKDGYFIEQQI